MGNNRILRKSMRKKIREGKSRPTVNEAYGDLGQPVLYIDAERSGYSIDQIRNTMTVVELISYLDQFNDETKVYLRHDGGYTYGGITYNSFEDDYVGGDDDGEDEEDEE